MQKILNIFIIFTLIALPMFSAVASVSHCQMDSSDSMGMIESLQEMASEHDCCDKPTKTSCSHCGECDCDNVQNTFSFLKPDNSSVAFSLLTHFEQVSYAVKVPNINSSLYRPPITIL